MTTEYSLTISYRNMVIHVTSYNVHKMQIQAICYFKLSEVFET